MCSGTNLGMVEAAGVEIYRDGNDIERLLHIQELGVLVDPTLFGVILGPRAERGQSEPRVPSHSQLTHLSTIMSNNPLGRSSTRNK